MRKIYHLRTICTYDSAFDLVHSFVFESAHDTFKKSDSFAVALPEMKNGNRPRLGEIIDIFSHDENKLETLRKTIGKSKIKPYSYLTKIKDVTEEFFQNRENFSFYSRLRVPRLDHENREKMERMSKSCPYLKLRSASTNQLFSLFFKKTKVNDVKTEEELMEENKNPINEVIIKTSSYGLSMTATALRVYLDDPQKFENRDAFWTSLPDLE